MSSKVLVIWSERSYFWFGTIIFRPRPSHFKTTQSKGIKLVIVVRTVPVGKQRAKLSFVFEVQFWCALC